MKAKKELISALCHEITLQREYLGVEQVETVYLGGGTPSILEADDLKSVFDALDRSFDLSSVREISVEANPEDISIEKLKTFQLLGINRLSIGIQSFQDKHLSFMNRSHNSKQALESVAMAQAEGYENISIDLIYCVPHIDHSYWDLDLRQAIELNIPHISAYCLTIEEKTAFGRWQKAGKLAPIDDHFAAEQFEMLTESLELAGYEAYEISNFARPGRYSQHNTAYWQQKKYLGIGPSAHSYNGSSRQSNVSNNTLYIKALKEGQLPNTMEILETHEIYNEYLLTTIRTSWGTDLEEVKKRFNFDLEIKKERELSLLHKEDLVFSANSTLYLTKKGRLLADEITAQLML